MVTRKAILAWGVLLSLSSPAARAEETGAIAAAPTETFSGQVGVVSDYVYRSVSYSDGHPAVQASFTWTGAGIEGLHLDGWVSSIDFGPGDPAKAEIWGTVGYARDWGRFTYDAGAEYATYPGAPGALHYSYVDVFSSLGTKAGPVALSATVRYSPDYSAATGPAAFADTTAQLPLSDIFSVSAALGYAGLSSAAGGKYTFWSVGGAAVWKGFTLTLRYHGSDLHSCIAPCGDRVVLGLSRVF